MTRIALLLCFFLCLMFALTASGGSPAVRQGVVIESMPSLTAGAQSPAQPAKDQKQEGGTVVEKDDAIVYVAFTLLVEGCLPNGTRLTSGFRTANDQLAVIRHYAQAEGIPVPANMRVDKPETWRPVLAKLRERGYIIADPDKTPHSSDDLIVFDLAGPDQKSIEAAVRRAERDKGL